MSGAGAGQCSEMPSRPTGRKRRQNEDAFVVRPAALRGRRRDGRRAGGRDRLRARSRRTEGVGRREAAARTASSSSSRRRTGACTSARPTTPATSGMGTTMTVALVEPDGSITFGHVGDSRALPAARRHARAADGRPLARRRARAPRRAIRERGRGAPAALGDHARARDRSGRRRRRVHRPPRGGRHLPPLLGRPLRHGRRRRRSPRCCCATAATSTTRRQALVQAANRGGGDDNITAVLFEIVDGDGSAGLGAGAATSETREYATVPPDEEDTLHPEDGGAG